MCFSAPRVLDGIFHQSPIQAFGDENAVRKKEFVTPELLPDERFATAKRFNRMHPQFGEERRGTSERGGGE